MKDSKNYRKTDNGTKPASGNGFGCHLFKSERVIDLIQQIDVRIDIMEEVSDSFKNIEGINLIELWKNLSSEIKKMWMEDKNSLVITLSKVQEIKLNAVADIVAQFFLYNGSKDDNDFLKNVGDLFVDINAKYGIMSTEERWDMLKKAIA